MAALQYFYIIFQYIFISKKKYSKITCPYLKLYLYVVFFFSQSIVRPSFRQHSLQSFLPYQQDSLQTCIYLSNTVCSLSSILTAQSFIHLRNIYCKLSFILVIQSVVVHSYKQHRLQSFIHLSNIVVFIHLNNIVFSLSFLVATQSIVFHSSQ